MYILIDILTNIDKINLSNFITLYYINILEKRDSLTRKYSSTQVNLLRLCPKSVQ